MDNCLECHYRTMRARKRKLVPETKRRILGLYKMERVSPIGFLKLPNTAKYELARDIYAWACNTTVEEQSDMVGKSPKYERDIRQLQALIDAMEAIILW